MKKLFGLGLVIALLGYFANKLLNSYIDEEDD